jgi:hypothetical protein
MLLNNGEMVKLLQANDYTIKENEGDDYKNYIVADKGSISLRFQWSKEPGKQFSSISVCAASSGLKNILSLQLIGTLKNLTASNQWICDYKGIVKLLKAVDIMTSAYDKLRTL